VIYNGRTFYRVGRYFIDGDRVALHRQVWEDLHGPIPPGWHIHHIDHNWLNNAPENLEALPGPEHVRRHVLERYQDPETRARVAAQLASVREEAAAWHRSPEGRAWHSQHGTQMWTPEGRARMAKTKPCEVCGQDFTAYHRDARMCSRACYQRAAKADRRYETLGRSCTFCGAEYLTNRHRPTETCSRSCGARLRHARARGER
jgi:hypothetical protein